MRNLATRLTEHKRATRKGDVNNHIAEHHRLTNHTIDWDSAQCLTYSTNYFQRLTLESWFTNLEQTPLNRCQPLPAPFYGIFYAKEFLPANANLSVLMGLTACSKTALDFSREA